MCDVSLCAVFETFVRSAFDYLAQRGFSIWKLFCHSGAFHLYDVPCPLMLSLKNHGFEACSICPVKDLHACDLVLPSDAKDVSQVVHVEALQLFQMPSVQFSSFTSVQETSEDNGFAHY